MPTNLSWPHSLTRRIGNFVDSQTHLRRFLARAGTKAVPTHWSFLFAQVAACSFVVLALSGAFLTFFYTPSMELVRYEGSYAPLAGVEMSKALHSVLDLSFEVRGGLLMRQVHHWSALLFIAALVLHILRIFFTGAFRRPRETAWVVLIAIFAGALATGLTGYMLPDDMLSGSSMLIMDGTIKAIPVVGASLSYWVFGGAYPGDVILGRLNTLHVLILPVIVGGLAAVRAILALVHKPMQFPAPGRTNDNVVGEPLAPTHLAKSAGLMLVVGAVTLALGATATINPVWLYGPADPGNAGGGSQPDWYFGFIDGALRLVPPGWEVRLLGGTVSLAVLLPMAIIIGFLVAVAAYPFAERWITTDTQEHHLLERPRNHPTRTAIGAAGLTFAGVLWAAGSADITAAAFSLAFEDVILSYQVLLVLGPPLAFSVTRRICLALQRKDREIVLHGRETGRIVRLPHGEFVEVHQPLDRYERWRLVDYDHAAPIPADQSKVRKTQRPLGRTALRYKLSKWFFEYRLDPVTPADMQLGPTEGHGEEVGVRSDPVTNSRSTETRAPGNAQ